MCELGASRVRKWQGGHDQVLNSAACQVLTLQVSTSPQERGSKHPRTVLPTESGNRTPASHLPEPRRTFSVLRSPGCRACDHALESKEPASSIFLLG